MSVSAGALRENLAEIVGDGLRSVIEYTESSYTVHYVRDDLASSPAVEQLDDTHEALLMRDFGRPFLEDVMDVGALESTTYRFEDAAVIHVVGPAVSGLYVTVDADVLEPAPAFTQRCREYLVETDQE